MKKLISIVKDPGVLFSTFHAITFGATAGVGSPIFALGAVSWLAAVGLKTRQEINASRGIQPSNTWFNKKGGAMMVNGGILSAVATTSFALGVPAAGLISAFFSVSNFSKGLEMNGSPYSLKSLGQKFLPVEGVSKPTKWASTLLRNTLFSAEFLASAGAFTVGYVGAGAWAAVGLAVSGTALVLAANAQQKKDAVPRWRSVAHNLKEAAAQVTPVQIQNALSNTKILNNIRSLNISDTAVVRGGMAVASASYGMASLVSDKETAVTLAVGQIFACAANARLSWLQHTVFDKMGAAPKPPVPQNLSVGQPEHKPHHG